MAEEAQTPEIDETDLPVEEQADETQAAETTAEEDDGEEIPTFGDTPEEEADTDNATIKHLRKVASEALKRAAEAERRASAAPAPAAIEVGKKPDLWDDCEGDPDKFETELDAWKERKAAAERQAKVATDATAEQAKAWEAKLAKAVEEKIALNKPDADEAFETVRAALGDDRIGGIIELADEGNVAKLIYALAKHPIELAKLASQPTPIRFLKEVTRLEGQLKMVKRRTPPALDVPETGSGRLSKEPADKVLERLEKEAERTHDRSKVIAYKRELKRKAQA